MQPLSTLAEAGAFEADQGGWMVKKNVVNYLIALLEFFSVTVKI